ncbi:ribosome alternative rescue factor ArfA [Vibrio parahaemolyticus]|uniref:alternative ribosome-rescue factor A n=1 Tax=Vibrio parahaemolyticus TaxID=670 RepID=UPI0004727131|nr:ribosome alternative rescue factor ArfA [Vibrio parahaemolyticus]MCI4891925.1 ribosome alternative rescue factor ArfA [Vibrio parahaemolyticus]MCR9791390.1 ribosome alternative rescue factor ArfA [Vibrio parahaemolyticus]MCR9827573.1 ribosome alternative rescue factor ArfA [Vibrio parahaemolyticus]MDF4958133.1 ribosome alternative rescue factor ArfA [Vibrio parahaemolyticus]MDF5174915.1 ribosome alternative rescue factor ArfA [Vibrio parahaemolyticus]
MAKAKCNPQPNEFNKDTEFGRGEIKDNTLKAVVTSQLFRTRVVKAKKGKGSFNRKMKHRGKEPYSKFSPMWILNRAFSCSESKNCLTEKFLFRPIAHKNQYLAVKFALTI